MWNRELCGRDEGKGAKEEGMEHVEGVGVRLWRVVAGSGGEKEVEGVRNNKE